MSDWQNRIIGYGEEEPEQLLANPRNHRIHPRRQQDALKGSLDTLGYIQTVIVNKTTQHIVDGHLRVVMAMRDGQKSIPVTYVELTPEEEAQALLSLDPIAAMAANDRDKVDELLRMVNTDNADVMKHLADFAAENKLDWGQPEQVDAEPQIDRAAELQKLWGTSLGQLWKLGEHRLLVGDCTVRENVERLMGGERAQMSFTSPPYGSKTGNLSGQSFYGEKEKDTFDDYVGFLCDFLSLSPVEASAPVFVNLSYNDNQRKGLFEFASSDKHGFDLYETFVWKKSRSMPLKGDNISRLCEFVFLFSKERYKIYSRDKINLGLFNFYETKKDGGQDWESGNLASFPVDFPEHFINLFSLKNHIIYEPFCGTGTTIMAAQNLGRRCYAMEISPAYCAVILQRFADATGIRPELVN